MEIVMISVLFILIKVLLLLIMPRIDFELWDRLYILKLICTAQMTYSSFITLIYIYLIMLQSWTTSELERLDVMMFKWSVIAVSVFDFGIGTLLAFAANMRDIYCARGLVAWLIFETFLIPVGIFLIMQLYYKIIYSKKKYETDPHYSRINIAQVCLLLCQYVFMAYVLDFLVYTRPKPKAYNPNIRPKSINAPTDPKITTTESRHIRSCQSFLSSPSSSKKLIWNEEKDDAQPSTSDSKSRLQHSVNQWRMEWRRDENDWKDEEEIDEEEINKTATKRAEN